jgi:hypothetical protein
VAAATGRRLITHLVDFFVVGVQKGGTTALDTFLRRHPGIQMAGRKEVHHFDDESIDWSAPDHRKLHEQFDWSIPNVIRGEATPIYCYWPNSMERLRRYNPGAKLIMGLRNPIYRAYSHWKMEKKRGADDIYFNLAIGRFGRARVREEPGGVHRVYSYVERGLYAGQIDRLFALFPREQVHFFRTDALWLRPGETLGAIQDFLGLAQDDLADGTAQYMVPIDATELGQMPTHHQTLDVEPLFGDDIRRTQKLTGIDLSDWFDPFYREPMKRSVDRPPNVSNNALYE